jgi:hypothetical protein
VWLFKKFHRTYNVAPRDKFMEWTLNMPRSFQAREKGIVTHPAYPIRKGTVPWPTARLSEYIIFTFVRDIHDKDIMKSDINIRKQTASKLDPRNGNVRTSSVVENLQAGPQSFPVNIRYPSIMFVVLEINGTFIQLTMSHLEAPSHPEGS